LLLKETRHSVLEDGRAIFRYTDPQTRSPFEVEIRCPLTSKLHSEHPAILEQHRQWARSFSIPAGEESYQRYCDTRLDLLASYQCHDLPLNAAVLHSHFMSWFFVFDDIMDIDHGLDEKVRPLVAELIHRHLDILDGFVPDAGDPHCIQAFYDFLKKARELSKGNYGGWYDRLVHHLREYVFGANWESMIGPTTEANTNTPMYLQVRHMAVGVAPCLDLMAIGAGIPGDVLTGNFFIQRLERLAINYSIWINDLAGLNRDLRGRLGNIVFTLQQDHSLSLYEATVMLARMCNAELDAFLTVEQQLPVLIGENYGTHKDVYDGYARVLKNWMRGLLDWSARTSRYQRLDEDMALQNERLIGQALRKDMRE
jgi:hypothetical protein